MKYVLIGEKLTHSFSREIHTRFFGVPYELQELSQAELSAFLTERDFKGINVTIPYKEAVLPYLDVVDDVAAQIGAVNTVINREGKLYGYNTDYEGLHASLAYHGVSLANKNVLILGSGGTSKTALALAIQCGCASVRRVSRTLRQDCITYHQIRDLAQDTQVLINATPCGMYPRGGTPPVDLSDLPHLEAVVDVVYNPLRTPLLCDAQRRGLITVGGLYMLVSQAVKSAELFQTHIVPIKESDLYRTLMAEKDNVVLIGMPGCGKTTVGKRLAQWMNRPFVDVDACIAEQTGCSIPELLQNLGEGEFRRIEADIIREISARQGCVVATGGGAVLSEDNVNFLKQNGRLYFLNRSLSLLPVSPERPLSATADMLKQRYNERYAVYLDACDVRIMADGAVEDVANEIREDFLHEYFGD